MVRFGIIGCGKIAQTRHIPEIAANPAATVAGVFDVNAERAAALAKEHGAACYDSYEAMLADPSIDAVVICTPNATHAEIACAALGRGKHTLCEKPMADTLENAARIARAAERSGALFMVAQNQRFDAVHRFVKQALESGAPGKVLRFTSNFITSGPENWAIEGGRNSWFFSKKSAGMGAMGDLGVHKLDLMRSLLGERFTEVSCFASTLHKRGEDGRKISVEDSAAILLRSESGVVGTVNIGWTYYAPGMDNATILYCENAVIKAYQRLEKDPCVIEYANGDTVLFQPPTIWGNSGVADRFVAAIEGHMPSPIPAAESLEVMETLAACFASAEQNKTIFLGGKR